MNKFQLDIITPTSINSYDNISYLRIPSLDGLTGIKAKHATAIIALTIGEIKITIVVFRCRSQIKIAWFFTIKAIFF